MTVIDLAPNFNSVIRDECQHPGIIPKMAAIFIIFILSLPGEVTGQSNHSPIWDAPRFEEIKDIQKAIAEKDEDTLHLVLYRKLGLFYLDNDTDSSFYYGNKQFALANKLHLPYWQADAMDIISVSLRNRGEYAKSLRIRQEALDLIEKERGNIPWNSSVFTDRIEEDLWQTLEAILHVEFGLLYYEAGNQDLLKLHSFMALNLAEKSDNETVKAVIYNNLGLYYREINRPDSAIYFFERSINASKKGQFFKYLPWTYSNLGFLYNELDDFDQSIRYFKSGIASGEKEENSMSVAENMIGLSRTLFEMGKVEESKVAALRAIDLFSSIGHTTPQIEAYELLANIYEREEDIENAYLSLLSFKKLNDSINSRKSANDFHTLRFNEELRLMTLEREQEELKNSIRIWSLVIGIGLITAFSIIFYLNSARRKRDNELLRSQKKEIEQTLTQLRSTQGQLVQSEKMASLGELTAGIAHEIQNPLNFVNNFSDVSHELVEELKVERSKLKEERDEHLEDEIVQDVGQNLQKIKHHGHRASEIVKSMLQHSRTSTGEKELTDLNTLCDEYVRLGYHGMRAKDKDFNAEFKLELDESLPKVNVVPQDMGRVLLNLINNAFYAVAQSSKLEARSKDYQPEVKVSTALVPLSEGVQGEEKIEIRVQDNGPGIPEDIRKKIFQPFFTTKPTGQGTGLGLSLSYDIVKAQGGDLYVETEGLGTSFIIHIPIS